MAYLCTNLNPYPVSVRGKTIQPNSNAVVDVVPTLTSEQAAKLTFTLINDPNIDDPSAALEASSGLSQSPLSAAAVATSALKGIGWRYVAPSGVSDYATDTANIQAACDALSAAGGGLVQLGVGTYYNGNTIAVPSNVIVQGAGRAATVILGKAGDYPGKTINGLTEYATFAMISVNNAGVRDLTVDHATNSTHANGIVSLAGGSGGNGTGCTNCVIERNTVLGYDSHEYLIWARKGTGIKILNNYLDGGVTTNNGSSQAEGIEVYGGTDVLVAGNTVKNIGSSGINVNPDAAVSGPANDLRIVDNYIAVAQVGIYIGGFEVHRILVRGNTVVSPWSKGVAFAVPASGIADDVQIKDNSCYGGAFGVYVYGDNSATISKIQITGNSVEAPTTTTAGGISAYYCAKIAIRGNVIRAASGMGMQVQYCNQFSITDNVVDAPQKHGIQIYNCVGGQVQNNAILTYNASAGSYNGVYSDTCSYINIDGNAFNFSGTQYTMYANPQSDRITFGPTNRNYAAYNGNPVSYNQGTNPNRGSFTLTATSTTKTITNTQCTTSSDIWVQQTGGTLRAFTLAKVTGSFTLTFASAAGDETFDYAIR